MKFLRAFVVFSVLPMVVGTAVAQDKVVVATLRSVSQACFWVALESGFYKEYGIEVVPVTFNGGSQTITSLISGDVQVTTTGGSTGINARIKGADVVLISTTLGIFPYSFYVSQRIRKAEDLKGKKIGISSFGGTAYPATRYAVEKLGLNPDSDVVMMQLGEQAARFAAMSGGTIDGTLLQPPETIKATELGFRPMVDLSQSGIKFPMNHNSTTRRFLKNDRDAVRKFMMGYIAGLVRLKTDRDFTLKVFAKYLRTSNEAVLDETYNFWSGLFPAKPYVERDEVDNYLKTLKDRGSAKPEDFMDNSIVSELDRQGFIDAVYKRTAK